MAAWLVVAVPATADAAQGGAAFIEKLGSEVLATLKATPPASIERGKKFRAMFAANFAVEEMGQFAVGQYWRTLNDAQKTEYLSIFKDYVAALYADKFATYAGDQFKVVDEREDAGNMQLVSAEIVEPHGKRIVLAFRLNGQQDALKINDVKVEGISLLVTKRSEFTSAIQRNGFPAFLADLKRLSKPASG